MKSWWAVGFIVWASVLVSGAAMAAPPKAAAAGSAAEAASGSGAKPAAEQPSAAEAADGSAQAADGGARRDPFGGLPRITGPKLVDLGHRAQIDLPADRILFERAAAQELIRKGGGRPDSVVAVVVATGGAATWAIVIHAEDVGYVDDSDAGELDAGELLDALKHATIAQNKTRIAMKIPELFVDDWRMPPRYERDKHHLVWATNLHDSDGKVVNFYTRLLGRDGYLAVNLIDSPDTIDASKVQALPILTAVHFVPGARYEDHVENDKSSGLGLKALIVGGAAVVVAKKTGILIAILLVLKKGIIFIVAAVGGFFKWLTGGRRRKAAEATTMAAGMTPSVSPATSATPAASVTSQPPPAAPDEPPSV